MFINIFFINIQVFKIYLFINKKNNFSLYLFLYYSYMGSAALFVLLQLKQF